MAGNSKTEKVELYAPTLEELRGGKYLHEQKLEMSIKKKKKKKTGGNKLVSHFSAASRTGGQLF